VRVLIRNQARLAIALVLILFLVACKDATLKTIAQAELDVATAVSSTLVAVQTLHDQKQISDDDARTIGQVLLKITQANDRAAKATRNVASLDPTTTKAVRDIVVPLIADVNKAISDDVVKITNPTARATIQTALTAIVTTLSIISAKLGGTA
jgi:hypothetical protein